MDPGKTDVTQWEPGTLPPQRSSPVGPPPSQTDPSARTLRLDSFLFPTYHVLFPITIFLSAFLLFQLQPMMGRYILPWFGGGPAVWTGCLLFFQTCLLTGYAYAPWLGSIPNVLLQVRLHVALLAASLLFLPIAPRAESWQAGSSADPLLRILILLTVTVGGPYFLLS